MANQNKFGWFKRHKVWTVVIAFLLIGTLGAAFGEDPKTTQMQEDKPVQVAEQASQPQATAKTYSYEVVKEYEIPNGGHGKVIVTSPDYKNASDMEALGKKLHEDNKNERNAFLFIFTDKKAADLRDKVTSGETLNQADQDFYDKHYVADYRKNANSGIKEFTYRLNGLLGESKTVNY